MTVPSGIAALILAALVATPTPARLAAQEAARIVTLGGSVTETVFALGGGANVVAVDRSSLHPAGVGALQQVGYYRTLSAEGVLSLRPTLIIASEGSGPPPVIDQLEASGVKIAWVPDGEGPEVAVHKAHAVAAALGVEEAGRRLAERIGAQVRRAAELRARTATRPRALFVWGHGTGGPSVAGSETGAAVMLDLAGAENAAGAMRGYHPMNAEAILLAAPDVLIVPETTVEGLGGLEGLLALPGVATTPAGKNRRIVMVDLLAFLGFGPRVGEALVELVRALHPEIAGTER